MKTARSMVLTIGSVLGIIAFCSLGAGSCNSPGGGAPLGAAVCLSCHNGISAPDQLEYLLSAHNVVECVDF